LAEPGEAPARRLPALRRRRPRVRRRAARAGDHDPGALWYRAPLAAPCGRGCTGPRPACAAARRHPRAPMNDERLDLLDALVYGDAFDCAVTLDELWRYSRVAIGRDD